MKLELMIRARAQEDQSIEAKHAQFLSRLSRNGVPWGFKSPSLPQIGNIGGELIEIVNLAPHLQNKITGSIAYVFRGGLRDEPSCDDHLHMQFDPTKVDYTSLLNGGIQRLIQDFGAYYAYVRNREFGYTDFEEKRKFNGRLHVFRINQVCFIDSELCERSLARKPDQICAALKGEVERVENLGAGMLLILSAKPLGVEEERRRGDHVKSLLMSSEASRR